MKITGNNCKLYQVQDLAASNKTKYLPLLLESDRVRYKIELY